jgi:hypothetical protein
MPCPHFDISIRSLGRNAPAVSGAAYISASKLYSEFKGQTVNFQSKQHELVHSEILLPKNAPKKFADRQTLWNSVDMNEKQIPAQVSRRIVMALPRELPMEQNIAMVREYCQKNFVDRGMCCDFAIHDPDPPGHNPHAHVMLTMRSLDENGKWLPKCRKVYDLDENGERIRLPSGRWKSHRENLNDWNDKDNAELWRESWEAIQNSYLERNDRTERVSLKSLVEQGIERQPTVHMGPAATAMERKGIETNIGNLNREIREANRLIDRIRNMISTFADWIAAVHEAVIEVRKQEKMRPKPVYLGDLLQAKLELRRAQRSTWSHGAQTKCSIKDMEKVLGYSDYLFRKKILTFGSFNDYLIEVNSEVDSIKKNISAKEKRVWEINRAKKALSEYHELRPIYQEYASIRWKGRKEKFGAEHKAELDSYRRSVWMIRKLIPGGNADFDTRTMEKEASQLTDEIIPLKEKLSTRQGELKKLQEIRRFIKDVLPEITTEDPEKEPRSIMERLKDNQERIRAEESARTKQPPERQQNRRREI